MPHQGDTGSCQCRTLWPRDAIETAAIVGPLGVGEIKRAAVEGVRLQRIPVGVG